jgi:hypothetical protein
MSRRSKSSNRSGNTVDMEVSHLFNLKDKSQYTNALLALRRKYKDEELVNKIQTLFINRHSNIVKGAKKFADAIRKRYGNSNVPFHQLLAKARAHAKKHNLSESEFAEFHRIYEQELSGTGQQNEVVIPVTNLMKVLGNITFGQDDHFNVNEEDYRYLQDILKLHETSKPLHAQCLLQSLQYKDDMSGQVLDATFDQTKNNPGEHVHPIIAAMFLPKVGLLESHFLYANISNIVKSRYNKEPLTTRPDYELFYNLVTDPNDVVCDSRTPVADLLNRCHLQNHIWNAVLHLRNGQVYNSSFREFITAVDVCRLNKYDNPDLVYGRHDGTIIKRILSAFSFRPTTVATLPMTNVFATNPYSQNMRPTVTSIPMINIRLNSYQNMSFRTMGGLPLPPAGTSTSVHLKDSLTQAQPFIEGNMLVQRISDVIYSRQILIFYVDRRAYLLQGAMPFNLSRLPTAIAGFERINDTPIEFDIDLTVRPTTTPADTFNLKSVVVAETNSVAGGAAPANVVIGSSTYIFGYTDSSASALASAPPSRPVPILVVPPPRASSPIPPKAPGGKIPVPTPLFVPTAAGLSAASGKLKPTSSPFRGGGGPFVNNKLYHYYPSNAFNQNKRVMYDVSTPPATGLDNMAAAMDKMKKQGVVFIYQKLDYAQSDENIIL